MARYWFRSRDGGTPWPYSWRGWAALAAFGLAEAVIWVLFLILPWAEGRLDAPMVIAWAALLGALVIGFVWMLRERTAPEGSDTGRAAPRNREG